MARGGYRPGAGRPKGSGKGAAKFTREDKIGVGDPIPEDVKRAAKKHKLTPLDYMLGVMNNAEADQGRRDRMAIAAAPFCHSRVADNRFGKKDERAAAAAEAAASDSVFAPPKLIVNND